MGAIGKARAVILNAAGRAVSFRLCLLPFGLLLYTSAASAQTHSQATEWTAAVAARQRFEASPNHTKVEYSRVMDEFRAIYHANPADAHASAAVAQVAELLAEEGHELGDAKSLHNAAAQYGFLIQQYPQSRYAEQARRAHLDVETVSAAPPLPSQNRETAHPAVTAPVPTSQNREPLGASQASPGHAANSTKPLALVSGIRHWSTASYTRVAIDLGDEVEYQAARVENPDRIFFDLHHAKLAPELVGKSFAVTDEGFLTRIRAAQFSGDVTRVVLDVHEVAEYSAFLLPNPYRLIIDIHGKPQHGAAEQSALTSAPALSANAESPYITQMSAQPVQGAHTDAGVSSLPPMPVTDGSASFGLPAKSSSGETTSAPVAAPRVVIPTRSTPARPVPNTVTSRSANSGTELAAVSEQPGKVEATHRPTSAPVSERSSVPVPVRTGTAERAGRTSETAPRTSVAAPAIVPPPTADGETSLLRALGLKIGRIVIDAGHGGHDSGTLGVDGIEEKDVVLDVALRLGRLLHEKLGAEIVYTRADDTFVPLETRTAIANKAQADLFISVHANSSQDASARGVEVYYLNFTSDPEAMQVASRENAVSTQSVHQLSDLVKKIALKDKIDESRELATDVDQSLYDGLRQGNAGLKNRGVKKAPFVVLIGANMPSILAEISFVTNASDAAQLATPAYRERVAESLFKGVERYAAGINGIKPMTAAQKPVQRAHK